ncbi:hypothetical protein O9G_001543 [Rozella allomycis CSF55]|uniref:Uncharacterized protein n=1 Tax=Rozella allomycis (strain CSF55) TaxID=988480 RepID=A0A075B4R3_ROZAC|nr:hypothetical protein O9G_001543 [Rozella allomycis CSF55]|eukprot:EPZ36559.1 hypothetical protein O9G_001543 [Rozella allomycis CSF55]
MSLHKRRENLILNDDGEKAIFTTLNTRNVDSALDYLLNIQKQDSNQDDQLTKSVIKPAEMSRERTGIASEPKKSKSKGILFKQIQTSLTFASSYQDYLKVRNRTRQENYRPITSFDKTSRKKSSGPSRCMSASSTSSFNTIESSITETKKLMIFPQMPVEDAFTTFSKYEALPKVSDKLDCSNQKLKVKDSISL